RGDANFTPPVNVVVFQAVQGTTYRIAVDARRFGGGTPNGGTFNLAISVLGSSVITSPTNNAVFAAGTPIPITAEASVPGATVSRIDFFRNGGLIGTDATEPFSMVYSNPPQGSNTLTAVAVDSTGASWNSPPVNIAVLATGVTITSPADGATFLNTNPITVTAAGLLLSGSFTNVDFFVDGTKFGQATAAPFTATWSAVTPGPHQFVAVGQATDGATYTSAPSYIGVARTLIASNAVWTYLDNNTDPGASWTTVAYDDSGWVGSGAAPLGYGDSSGRAVATTTGFGPDANNKYVTTYFRRRFNVANPANFTNLVLRYERDDGAVVYLNGVEVARNNMPAGAIAQSTFASSTAGDDGTTVLTVNLPASQLVAGSNVVAVEIHQDSANSSDIWFVLQTLGVPTIPRNQAPVVDLTSPTNNAVYTGPTFLMLAATASDPDVGGSVAKVEFLVDGAKLGEATAPPYEVLWNSPVPGWHTVQAVATDDQGASTSTPAADVLVFDPIGNPLVTLLTPTNGASYDGPTNLFLSARAATIDGPGTYSVSFLTNGAVLATDTTAPFSFTWTNATFGTNRLAAMVTDEFGNSVTSLVATVVVVAPPPNLAPPTVVSISPAAGSEVTNFTSWQVLFSERVIGVNAGDVLINGVPATGVSGTTSNYTFTFPQPAVGEIEVAWAPGHGIEDVGYPPLPFTPPAAVAYNLIDAVPPTIIARVPAAGATVTNLTQVSVTFSEPVNGVGAADFLVNGAPALSVSSVGSSNFTFSFAQPAGPNVSIAWLAGHGITDQSATPNPFNATGAGATWSYTLDNRTILVQSNSLWRFQKGLAEVSAPVSLWRTNGFDDSGWSNAAAPFFYGDTVYASAANPGTLLSDMLGGYSSVFLRRTFVIPTASAATNLFLSAYIDDGMVVWVNGVEVLRVNMAAGEVAYNSTAPNSANEPGNNGIPYTVYTLPNPAGYLVDGTNTITVHGFNNNPTSSTDFGFNGQLYTFLLDPSLVAPTLSSVTPAAGDVFVLTNLTVRFSEPVTGVDAADLRVNGVPATGLASTTNTTYTFSFAQPAYGTVNVTWDPGAEIVDLDTPPKPFNASAGTAAFSYRLLNPSAPVVAAQTPVASSTVTQLTQVTVNFSEPVNGVDAADLVVNLVPASGVTGTGANYTFTFPQPAYGAVSIGWSGANGIADLETPPNSFDLTRPGQTWTYTLVDQIPPVVAAKAPAAGATVTNLTSLTVTFSEAVTGVNAGDLLLNGVPATGVTGGPTAYSFSFPQPNATVINVSWIPTHGIRDLATVPNAFNATGPGATWSYLTPDTVAPALAAIDPPAGVTVRSLNQIRLTFTEPVTGLDTNDLLINNRKPHLLTGSGAGPYTFTFLPPTNGAVDVRIATTHGITDLATPPNSFPGAEWTYFYDPAATFAGKVLIHEIMFNPPGGLPAHEWIELHNTATNLINLTGWRFSRGLNYTFPNVAIPAGGHLVVAANVAAFQANYPGVTNVVGGWTGQLANREETLELVTPLGEVVNEVHYATAGDWARRERGRGAVRVESVALSGTTATITVFNHGYTTGDRILLSGADQPALNGIFAPASITPTTFNVTLPTAPGAATGNILARQILDENASGWAWVSLADGLGSSLELVNPLLPNQYGQNWQASTTLPGTPGAPNSTATNNVPPLVLDVTHTPAIPRSTESVAITARVRDELSNGVAAVQLFWRNHSTTAPGPFTSVPMFDRGTNADGLARDGLYGAVLPPSANRAVIEFYVEALDSGGRSRTWPAPAWNTNNTFAQLANAYYQVDDEVIPDTMPSIRLIFSGTEQSIYNGINQNSDAEQNITLVTTDAEGTKIRYGAGMRIRGAGSRSRNPKNNRINIPNDNPWNGLNAINLNAQFVHAQLMGAAVARKAGLPASEARVVQYRTNGVNPAPLAAPANGSSSGAGYGTFLLVEPVNGDLAANLFPEDGDGNVYRASTGNHNADLTYLGAAPSAYLGRGYTKTSNQTENDWTDLLAMTAVFSQASTPADFVAAISTNINVTFWMRYFAVGSLINYGETSLFNGRGDDYALYRGLQDRRFVLIGHDFDTCFGQGDTINNYNTSTNSSPFIFLNPPNTAGQAPNTPVLRRLFTNNAFAPFFYAEVKRIADEVLAPGVFNPLIDRLLSGWGNGPTLTTINDMKAHVANRRSEVLRQIPLALTVTSTLGTSNGLLYTTTPIVTLSGTAHAIDTRKVLVAGAMADWDGYLVRWTQALTLQPGINRVTVQSLNSNDVAFAEATVDIWYDDGTVQTVSGALAANTTWTPAGGPYQLTGNVTVNAGVTLTILPGTTVFLAPGVSLTVANGGRLLAEGNAGARIRFTRVPGAGNWTSLVINGGAGSPETRIAYADLEGHSGNGIDVNAGDLYLGQTRFLSTTARYLDLDASSFVVEDCHFPAATAAFEPIHGSTGIKAGGRGIFRRCFIGKAQGYNDAIDFTGGNRPGPILQVLNCVFAGSDDDLLDLDSTDAWIEGNIFLHVHRNGSPDSASAISGGADNADTSQVTALGNLFFDVDQAANAKQGNFYTFLNNTIVNQNRTGSQDTESGVITMADDGTALGLGLLLEGNIISGAERLVRTQGTAQVTFTNNVHHQVGGPAWTGPGGNNSTNDPLLRYVPTVTETRALDSWQAAQVLWTWFSLRPGSPALGAGPDGRDQGAVGARGAAVAGLPPAVTPDTSATLRVGPNRTGRGIPAAGFPLGSGFTHYRWRLDGGPWSAETPVGTPLSLSGLASGPHFVEVSGRNDAGFYQDDPIFGADAQPTVSRTWTVNVTATALRLSEVLAANSGAFNHFGTTPDAIEVINASASTIDLSGMGVSDDVAEPFKFAFPPGTTLAAGARLVLLANNPDGTAGLHLGFSLGQSGDAVYLREAAANGGALVDSVVFGLQVENFSIARGDDGGWFLAQPTLGAANRPAATGDPARLRLNEWLAEGTGAQATDFVELYNTDPNPVALGGLYLSDELVGWPDRHAIAPLSFVAGFGYTRFLADGAPELGADHLGFSLTPDQGELGLFTASLGLIDCVYYQPQYLNRSQGRSPNGSSTIVYFNVPTPGAPNPISIGPEPNGNAVVINEVLANNRSLAEAGRTPDWVEIYNGTAAPVTLDDMSLTDNTLQPRRFVFGTGTVLGPGQFLRVLCDTGATNAGPLVNTNFALKSSGGALYLFDRPAAGGSLSNALTYGLQAADFSIGRFPDGSTNWVLNSPTPGASNAPIASLGDPAVLRVNEWMAAPAAGEDDWFEIYNPGLLPVALGGLYLTDNLGSPFKHAIAPLSFLGTGTNAFQVFIADNNPVAGADHVSFSLNAVTESVGLSTMTGLLLDGYTYGPQATDVSQGRFPDGAAAVVTFPGTSSPGESNWRWLTTVAINEVLTHTDLPLEDAIELRNLTGSPIDLGGWWLSDDGGTLQKYQIPPATLLPANGYLVIYENVLTNDATADVPFRLSSTGDEVVLSASSNNVPTGFRTRVSFGAAANGVSFGRYVTSDGRAEMTAMSGRSFGVDDPGNVEQFRTGTGAANPYPKVGPVILSEIHYHPPDLGTNDNTLDEFIELRNITTATVSLHDGTNGWRLRDGVDFDFPPGTQLPPDGELVVVSFDPVANPAVLAAFRSKFGMAPSTPVLGPWIGRLANAEDEVELRRPDAPNLDGVPYVLVEQVRYFDLAPWPPLADGTGFSLQRVSATGFGNDPTNWVAATPSPGPAPSTGDSDGDGMPDNWEVAYSLDPLNPADAALDSDGDGLNNLQEFQVGTNPRDASSVLRVGTFATVGTNVVLTFSAAANVGYTVQTTPGLGTAWSTFQAVPAAPTNRTVQVLVLPGTAPQFFRLRANPPQ
ncbi:MAG: Inner spore coat protein, partial [Verrucomicrobiota bacterium]